MQNIRQVSGVRHDVTKALLSYNLLGALLEPTRDIDGKFKHLLCNAERLWKGHILLCCRLYTFFSLLYHAKGGCRWRVLWRKPPSVFVPRPVARYDIVHQYFCRPCKTLNLTENKFILYIQIGL